MKGISLVLLLVHGVFSFGQNFEVVQLPLPRKSKYKFAQCEPSIAIHPKNPEIMIAGAILSDYYYSKNGGKSWKSKSLKSMSPTHLLITR